MITDKDRRRQYVEDLRFRIAIDDCARKLSQTWADIGERRRPLNRAYELLHPHNIRQAIVECCIDYTRQAGIGTSTILNPTDERQLAQLFYKGAIAMPELPSLRPHLNSWSLGALQHGVLLAWGLEKDEAATGKHRRMATDRWQFLQPNFKESTASVDGKPIVYGVEVEVVQSTAAPSTHHKVSRADLAKWYVDMWIPSCRAAARIPTRDDDFAAAKVHFDDGSFDRDWLRDLRPPDWSRRGKRPAPKLAG